MKKKNTSIVIECEPYVPLEERYGMGQVGEQEKQFKPYEVRGGNNNNELVIE